MKYIMLIAAMSVSSGALADKLGPYVGVGISANYHNSYSAAYNASQGEGDSKGISLHGGYRFNQYLAAEIELGYEKAKFDDLYVGSAEAFYDFEGDALVGSLSILPMMPINENLDAYLSLGYSIRYLDEVEYDDFTLDVDAARDGFTLGAGFMWHANESLYGKVGVKTMTGDDNANFGINASIGFKF